MFRATKGKPENNANARAYSVAFADHLTDLDPNSPLYKSVKQAVDLCGAALNNVKSRVAISDKLHECEAKISGLSYIDRMTPSEMEHFKDLLAHFTSLSQERASLLDRLARFDKALPVLDTLGNQAAGKAVAEMREAETYHSALRRDISYLEGEKEDLNYENNYLTASINFISKFSVGLAGLILFAAALLGFMAAAQGADVLMYGVALIFLSITAAGLIYMFRKKIAFELNVNGRKRQKAIHTLNQKSTVFAFYSNFLSYCYEKYHVRSSSMLESNLNDYEQYRRVTSRIDNVRNIMYQTRREIEDIMREKKIDQDKTTMEGYAKNMDLDSQKRARDALAASKAEMENRAAELERRHEAIWNLLERLKEDRPEAKGRIENVIQTYLDEVGRVLKEGAAA